MKARRVTPAILALLMAPAAGGAEGLQGRFAVSFQAGTQSELSGSITAASTGSLLGKPASIEQQSYKDAYRPDLRLSAVLAYGIAPKVELFVRGSRYKADNQGIEIGAYQGKPMFGFFTDYEEQGGEIGLRYCFAPQARLKSYLGPVAGLRHVKETLVSFEVPEAGTAVRNVPFTQKGNAAVFGADLGFTFDLTPNFYLGVDTGLRYQKAPEAFGSLPELGAFEGANARWTAPVSATVGVRF